MQVIILLVPINQLILVISVLILILVYIFYFLYSRKLIRQNNQLKARLDETNKLYIQVQNELELVKKKAEESDKLKSSFLANMSHEIRTPLNAIMGFSSLLQQTNETDDENHEYIEIIHKNSNKLLDMMDEIFNIALIESGITKMYKENCLINELLTGLVTYFNLEKDLNGKTNVSIRIRKSTRDHSFSIYTDPRKLRQTLFNLIENALKYTNEGYVEVGYELKDNSIVEFYVKDSGMGFPQEKLDVVFQRFRQVDESNTRNFGGIGLGLTLSQKFVEMMGGEMRGVSTPGNGSIFYFTIPYIAYQESEIAEKHES